MNSVQTTPHFAIQLFIVFSYIAVSVFNHQASKLIDYTYIVCTTGRKLDSAVCHPDGIQGFPSVLQQMSKILNFSHSSHGPTKISKVTFLSLNFTFLRFMEICCNFLLFYLCLNIIYFEEAVQITPVKFEH